MARYAMFTVTWCLSQCCVPSRPTSKPLGFHCICLRPSSHCKHECSNTETLKRTPTPLFGRPVRCSAHGRSFGICIVHAALLAITVYNDIQLLCSYLQLLCSYIQLLCNHSLKFKSQKVSVDYSAAFSLLGARSLCNSGLLFMIVVVI